VRCRTEEDHRRGESQEVLDMHKGWGVLLQGAGFCNVDEQPVVRPGINAPVVALDIDGTCGDYHAHFTHFMELWTGRPMPNVTQFTGGVHFSKHLGMSRKTYNAGKLAFRQGGWKRWMPAYDGIGDFTKYMRGCGVQVWICTTRPYLQLPTVDPDTRHWLRRNGLQYDAVLYGPHKYRDLVEVVDRKRVLMVYDDLPEMVEQAMGLGLPVTIRTQPYNVYWGPSSGIVPAVSSVAGMKKIFDESLEKWRVNR
jgi:hypothetical protein